MHKHKLYRGSSKSPILNFSMESRTSENGSPPNNSNLKVQKDKATNHTHGNTIEDCSNENSLKTENDSMDESFFSEFLEKRPYSFNEDVEILNFVLKDQNIYRVSSVLLWKYLEAKKRNPKRTYHSLKNRFLRNIKPKIFTTYRHLIKSQDQIDKILNKFPELQKDAKIREPLEGLFLRKKNEQVIDNSLINQHPKENSAKSGTAKPADVSAPLANSQVKIPPVAEGSEKKKVILFNDSIFVTVPKSPENCEISSFDSLGIYQKYLKCKAKNKLIPCSACGRCGSPEPGLIEVENSENENDDIISNSIENKNFQSPQPSTDSKSEINSSKNSAIKNKDFQNKKRRRNDSLSTNSRKTSESPSLLDEIKGPDTLEIEILNIEPASSNEKDKRTSEKSTPTKSTSSDASDAKYLTPAEKLSGCLTNEELESLRQGTLQNFEKLVNPEEEEALVKKCFKKNRRSFGIDSFLLQNKGNLDSFFAKSESPTLDSLSADTVTSTENNSDESPLVKNMKKMLRSRKFGKS